MKSYLRVHGPQLRSQKEKVKDSPHKHKNEGDAIMSVCIAEIITETEYWFSRLTQALYKNDVELVNNGQARIVRDDEFGGQKTNPDPVFSNNQVALMKNQRGITFLIIVFLLGAEAVLYFLTAAIFVPNGSLISKLFVGLFLALLITVCVDLSIRYYHLYLDASERHSKKELSDFVLKKYKLRKQISIVFAVGSILALLCAGISRVYFIEGTPPSGLSVARAHSIEMSSRWASLLTLITTIMVSIFLGFKKYDLAKINQRYKEYRLWCKAISKGTAHRLEIIRLARKIQDKTMNIREKSWQLVVDLKRIFLEREHDLKFDGLYTEYLELRGTDKFTVTDEIYRKYAPIQTSFAELFRFGVLNEPVIASRLATVSKILSAPESYIAEQLRAIKEAESRHASDSPFILNKQQKPETITLSN